MNNNETQKTTKKKIRYPNKDFSDVTNLKENIDYVVCRICGHKGADLISHLRNKHNMLSDEYRNLHGKDSEIKAQYLKDKLKGSNNPAYQHGGKYSPFSDKFIKGTSKVEEIKLKAKQNKTKDKDSTQIEYWLEKTNGDLESAKKLLSKRQSTFSIEKCIENYGQEQGKQVWLERQYKWQKTLNNKSLEEKKRINRLKVGNGYSVSNAERELLKIFLHNGIMVEHQFSLFSEKKEYIYDFEYNKKIIEYNGDWWHCNPNKYKDSFYHPRIKMSAKEIQERDIKKQKYAVDNGYKILIVWENDYKNNKREIIEKCLDFLKQ